MRPRAGGSADATGAAAAGRDSREDAASAGRTAAGAPGGPSTGCPGPPLGSSLSPSAASRRERPSSAERGTTTPRTEDPSAGARPVSARGPRTRQGVCGAPTARARLCRCGGRSRGSGRDGGAAGAGAGAGERHRPDSGSSGRSRALGSEPCGPGQARDRCGPTRTFPALPAARGVLRARDRKPRASTGTRPPAGRERGGSGTPRGKPRGCGAGAGLRGRGAAAGPGRGCGVDPSPRPLCWGSSSERRDGFEDFKCILSQWVIFCIPAKTFFFVLGKGRVSSLAERRSRASPGSRTSDGQTPWAHAGVGRGRSKWLWTARRPVSVPVHA